MEAEIQEVVFAFVLSFLKLDNASELTSVSSLKWFRNVTHWPKVSVTEISPPIWYSVRLLNKNHVIENISEGGTDQKLTYGKMLSFWFSLLNLCHSRSHGKLLKFCLCHLSYKFYLVKLRLERFHCFVHTRFTPRPHPCCSALLPLPFSLSERLEI